VNYPFKTAVMAAENLSFYRLLEIQYFTILQLLHALLVKYMQTR